MQIAAGSCERAESTGHRSAAPPAGVGSGAASCRPRPAVLDHDMPGRLTIPSLLLLPLLLATALFPAVGQPASCPANPSPGQEGCMIAAASRWVGHASRWVTGGGRPWRRLALPTAPAPVHAPAPPTNAADCSLTATPPTCREQRRHSRFCGPSHGGAAALSAAPSPLLWN